MHSIESAESSITDSRGLFQRDRDRILYSSAFQRLNGVTQIVRSAEEGNFHNRLYHSLKVGQIGRRLSEKLIRDGASPDLLDPDVVEAACLAHDLGHPPFGHAGEKELNRLVLKDGNADGYEGNAQSFRIVSRLAVRFDANICKGLNLTRATMAALLKYPWSRGANKPKSDKWGFYTNEKNEFEFASEFEAPDRQSFEASIMDWSDDIAYSVHDLEDFHRCDSLPWVSILSRQGLSDITENAFNRLTNSGKTPSREAMEEASKNVYEFVNFFEKVSKERYVGSSEQRWSLKTMTSGMIGRFISSTSFDCSGNSLKLIFKNNIDNEVEILKQISIDYIFCSPSLSAQQKGHKRVISDVYDEFSQFEGDRVPNYVPHRLRYLFDLSCGVNSRFAADCISSMNESELVAIRSRLRGTTFGSVTDPIVR